MSRSAVMRRVALFMAVMMVVLGVAPSIAYGAAGEKSDNSSSDNAFFEFMFSQLETVTTKGVAVHEMGYSVPTNTVDTAPGESDDADKTPSGFPTLTLEKIAEASKAIYNNGTYNGSYTIDGATYNRVVLITQYTVGTTDNAKQNHRSSLSKTYIANYGIYINATESNIRTWPSGHFASARVNNIFASGTIVLIEDYTRGLNGCKELYNIVTDTKISAGNDYSENVVDCFVKAKENIAVFGVAQTESYNLLSIEGSDILKAGNPTIYLNQLGDSLARDNKNLNICVNSENIIFEGITFDGGGRNNRTTNNNEHLLTVSNSNNVILRNITLKDVTGTNDNDLYISNSSVFIDGLNLSNLKGNNEVADITFVTPKESYVNRLDVSTSTRQYPININDAIKGVAFTDLTINDKIPIRIDKAATDVKLPIDDARPFLVIDNGKYLYFPTYSAAKTYISTKALPILDASVGYYMIDAKSTTIPTDVENAIKAGGGSTANIKLVIDGTEMPTVDLSYIKSIGTLFPIDAANADIPGFPADYKDTFFDATYDAGNYNFKVGASTTLYNVNYATTEDVVAADKDNPVELHAIIGETTLVHCSYYYGTPGLTVISVTPPTLYQAGGNSVVRVETEYLDDTKVIVLALLEGNDIIDGIHGVGDVKSGFTITFPKNTTGSSQVYSIWTSIDGGITWDDSARDVTVLSGSVSIDNVAPKEHGPAGDDSDVTFSVEGIELDKVDIRAVLASDETKTIGGNNYGVVDTTTGKYTLTFPTNDTGEDRTYYIESSTDGVMWVRSEWEVTVEASFTNLKVNPEQHTAIGGDSYVTFDVGTDVDKNSIQIKAINRADDSDFIETDSSYVFKLVFGPNTTAADKIYEIYTMVGNGDWIKSELIVTVTAASISKVTVDPTSQPQTGGISFVEFEVEGINKENVKVQATLPDGTIIKGEYNSGTGKFEIAFPPNNTYSDKVYTIQTSINGNDWANTGFTVTVPGRRNTGGGGTTTTPTPTPTPTPSPSPVVTITPEPSIPLGTPTPAPTQSTGWQQGSGNNGPSYINDDGSLAKGWKKLTPPGGGEAVWYYFDENGYAKSGWLLDGKNSGGVGTPAGSERWYYLYPAAGGTASKPAYSLAIGWNHLHWKGVDNWYYFKTDGVMYVGWLKNGKNADGTDRWFYLKPNRKGVQPMGSMNTGWVKISGMWYYCNDSGVMQTGWVLWNGSWYYLKASGAMVANAWQQVGGKWYWFNSSGAMVTGTQTINGKTYRFDSSGAWIS